MLSIVDGTDAAKLKFSDIDEMGFSVVLYAVSALFSAVRASSEAHASSKQPQNQPPQGY